MKRQGCLIICLLILGVIGAYSDPQDDKPSDIENHEEVKVEEGDLSEQYENFYAGDSSESSGERVKRDTRRPYSGSFRRDRLIQAQEHARMEAMAQYLIDITHYYEQVLHLSHDAAVHRVLRENLHAARQVMMHAERNRRPPLGYQ